MIVTKNIDLKNFKFWSGAKHLAEALTQEELEQIEFCLEDFFHDKTPSETEIKDLFWFEEDFICKLIGETAESVLNRD